ncbi:hypothetical protein A9264_04735 [Vibrio sp. UCD-FRSSP16_10]|nr:hypothetical protein A9260_06975 [Vibrio sp. UCD-FRSSP16_30]OBT18073.1 hypothetical protein A9264_04735 [Vibrio sp. UCD-FRSSP16_10]
MVLSGCAGYINANQYSMLDHEVTYAKDENILVTVDDQNDSQSQSYIQPTIDALHKRGFSHVFTKQEIDSQGIIPDIRASVVMKRKFEAYQYVSDDYGMVETGTTHTKCNKSGTSCTTTNEKKFAVVGSSAKNSTRILTTYILNFWNVKDQANELFAKGYTDNESCGEDYLYQFLVEQTIDRLDFAKPTNYTYMSVIPMGTNCKRAE